MSLNGLDGASIKEAHDAAAAELGGWFLLKYISRDEIGLLGRGTGGIVEIRNAVAQYEEPSPLYGFLRYRRRNVLINYMPEDCSRLIKARSTVHFNAVTERFSPHDTIFPISTAKELRDLELSAACSLHTASGSTSSSTSSLRRRRLMEIAEDEEEDSKTKRQSTVLEELASTTLPSVTDGPPPPASPPPPSVSDEVGELHSPGSLALSPTKTIESRKSSQSTRPDLYSYPSHTSTGKPKVKLGPRPSLEVGGRPHTPGATSQSRPVSTLPAGLKFSRSPKSTRERPKSHYNMEATSMLLSAPPIPESGQVASARPHTSGGRPTTSSGASIRSLASTTNPKSPTMTPEKARLMKALQLRKKQMKASPSSEHLSPTTSEESQSVSTPTASPLRESMERPSVTEGAPKNVHDTLAMLNDMAKEEDSGIAFDNSSVMRTDGSDATRSDSYPVSPVGNSDKAESSKASSLSSLSQSTEETVHGDDPARDTKEEQANENAVPSLSELPKETPIEQVQDVETTPPTTLSQQPEVAQVGDIPTIETATTEEAQDEAPQSHEPGDSPDENIPSVERLATGDGTQEPLPRQGPEPEVAAAEDINPETTAPTEPEPEVPAAEQINPEATTPTEPTPNETVPEEPAPSVEEPIDELPCLLPVTYQPPTSVKPQGKKEVAKEAQEPAPFESVHAPEETVTETLVAPEVAVPASPAISSVENKQQPQATSNALVQEPKAEALSELKNHNDSLILAKATDEKTLKPKKSLVIATEEEKVALVPRQSPLLSKSPVEVEIKEWKIPRSKFSIPDLKVAAASPISTEPLPSSTATSLTPIPKSPADSHFSADTRASATSDDFRKDRGSKRMKRQALVEPIRTDIDLTDRSHAGSEANFSSDDDLMEELQSAVVQEAQPISVSKSPMSPHFPNDEARIARASSNPLLNDGNQSQLLSPNLATRDSGRSVSASASYMNRIAQQSSRPIVKKVNLGSGISQRIKALENISKAAPAADTPPSVSSSTSATFFSVRKGSVRNSKSPSIVDRTNSLTRNTPSPPTSQNSSPETLKVHSRSDSVQNRVDAFVRTPSPIGLAQRQRPESVSVTARIIRDPNHPFPAKSEAGKNPLDYTPLDLKQSPLLIDHHKGSPGKEPFDDRLSSSSSKGSKAATTIKEKRSSMSVMKDFIKEGRASFSETRRSSILEPSGSTALSPVPPSSAHSIKSPRLGRSPSIGSRRSSRGGPSPTRSIDASSPTRDEGKSNRASRILQRMSSSMTSSRKTLVNAISPTLREENEPPMNRGRNEQSATISSINIGDVNVQFPDTLLWKRRFVMLDSQGYLIISPALSAKDQKHAGATRRMHLSEFRTPMIPDVEMQELPNSVVLDFIEGSGLQIACEDRGGQARILNILQEAHVTWVNYGP